MNYLIGKIEKRPYQFPHIEVVVLDNEISLALESDPPTYESINVLKIADSFDINPFK
jgi:hypothetical protein